VLILELAQAREGEHYGSKQGLRTWPIWPNTAQVQRAGATELQRGRINHGRAEIKETEHESEFLISRR
jgi:hypothetical protein